MVDEQDGVHVIRHDYEGVQNDIRTQFGCLEPFFPRNLANRAQAHGLSSNLAQHGVTVVGTNRHEIRTFIGVIE